MNGKLSRNDYEGEKVGSVVFKLSPKQIGLKGKTGKKKDEQKWMIDVRAISKVTPGKIAN